MKSLRVWLLVLLAFALPLRGAMAAAMPCAPTVAHAHAAVAAGHAHAHAPHAGHSDAQAHAEPAHDHGSTAAADAPDKCSFCASCCSVSLAAAFDFQLPRVAPAAARFPEALAPDAEFLAGGQERPPRSIRPARPPREA